MGPAAARAVELWWLRGAPGEPPALAERALRLAEHAGHRTSAAEVTADLRRAGRTAARAR